MDPSLVQYMLEQRAEIPPGPWDDDMKKYPDPSYWPQWEYKGLHCEMRRGARWTWSGYVQVGPDHPDFGKKIHQLQDLDVPQGVSFSFRGLIGFDHAHRGVDWMPGVHWLGEGLSYATFDQVKAEVEQMADLLLSRKRRADKRRRRNERRARRRDNLKG